VIETAISENSLLLIDSSLFEALKARAEYGTSAHRRTLVPTLCTASHTTTKVPRVNLSRKVDESKEKQQVKQGAGGLSGYYAENE
jgi:hypothetical protein